MKAFTSPPTHHGIFAQVVMRTPAVHVSMPYRVHEIFKILSDTGHKCWYDPAKKIWVMTGDSATDVLKWIVQVVCQRDLSDYKTAWRTAESAVEIESQWKFSNQSFVKAVADTCRTHLCVHSSDWHLDDESTRHLLNFEGMVLNSKTLEWTPVRPTMRITRSAGWSHSWPAWWETPVMEKLEAALEEVRRQQNSFWGTARVDPGRLGLDDLRTHAPGQGHFRAEAGRGAVDARRGAERQGHSVQPDGFHPGVVRASTFSKIRDPNAPSPVYALCRARRFVSIREVDGSETMRLQVYKKFTDPISELSGRDLYEKIVRYKPQFLAFFAANEPPPLVSDYAVRQRTAIVEHISVFTDNPVEANQKTWVPVEDTIRSTTPSFFAILHMVYKHLLKDRPMRSIGPIPTKCLALLKVEVKDEVGDLVRSFLSTKTGTSTRPASPSSKRPAGARGRAAGQAGEAQRRRPAEECGRGGAPQQGRVRLREEDQRPLLDVQIRGRRGEEGLERQLHPPREVRG